jgi:hypothetical protein
MTTKTSRTALVLRLRQRFAIAATALFILISGSRFTLEVQAADPANSPHESAVLDRIFANLRSRHDREHGPIDVYGRGPLTLVRGSLQPASVCPSFFVAFAGRRPYAGAQCRR